MRSPEGFFILLTFPTEYFHPSVPSFLPEPSESTLSTGGKSPARERPSPRGAKAGPEMERRPEGQDPANEPAPEV